MLRCVQPCEEEEIERDNNTEIKEYKLPDGKVIKLGPECFRAPEILFSPSIIGTEYGGVPKCLEMQSLNLTWICERNCLVILYLLVAQLCLMATATDY